MKNKAILIVDDDEGMLDILDKYIRRMGYQTRKTVDGSEAIKILQEDDSDFGLLITDLVMPNLSGPKLIDIVKKEYSQIKIIACTGYGRQAGQYIDNAGVDAILYKPLRMNQLESIIKSLL